MRIYIHIAGDNSILYDKYVFYLCIRLLFLSANNIIMIPRERPWTYTGWKRFYNMQKDKFSLLKGMTQEENMCNMWLLQSKKDIRDIWNAYCWIKNNVLINPNFIMIRTKIRAPSDTIDELIQMLTSISRN